jgi:hypothetical protein
VLGGLKKKKYEFGRKEGLADATKNIREIIGNKWVNRIKGK